MLKEATLVVRAKNEAKDTKETVSYLKFQNWSFNLSGKNVISSFEERLKPKGEKKTKGGKSHAAPAKGEAKESPAATAPEASG